MSSDAAGATRREFSSDGEAALAVGTQQATTPIRTSLGFIARLGDFSTGLRFRSGAGEWRYTDIGTRVIVAIRLDSPDPSWYEGPPYAVAESVFDESDQAGCWTVDDELHGQDGALDAALVNATDAVLTAVDTEEHRDQTMAYMRGVNYLWSDGRRLHVWVHDGLDGWAESGWSEGLRHGLSEAGRDGAPSGVAIDQETVDEYVVMRFAELLRGGHVEARVRRALERWRGNAGCEELQGTVDALRAR